MSKRIVLVAFNGEPMCFVHVLLNALDMAKKEYDVKVVIEGSATRLVNEFNDPDTPFGKLYVEVRNRKLIDCVCRACASKMKALEGIQAQYLPLCNDMMGHPALATYIEKGYDIITF